MTSLFALRPLSCCNGCVDSLKLPMWSASYLLVQVVVRVHDACFTSGAPLPQRD